MASARGAPGRVPRVKVWLDECVGQRSAWWVVSHEMVGDAGSGEEVRLLSGVVADGGCEGGRVALCGCELGHGLSQDMRPRVATFVR